MPPKRQNISLHTNAAKRKCEERQNEREEETAERNEGNRLNMSQPHATESSQQHEARNDAGRIMGLKVDNNDIKELMEDLTTKELTELHCLSHHEVMEESLSEKEEVTPEQQFSGLRREMLKAWVYNCCIACREASP
ncbi:hypothetical protein AVEN_168213-1 [Araneus ventricosus]|uniref:Uncharacterized protein n=1 Tax=Araneus ventricosus TaxID=182803 RepID=A0A4Y2NA59_ARAVE|nr:hypothetical protein AVEN_168213-1 [Araneus ventricosus]